MPLSNWDRFEVPYDNYGKEKLVLYEKTKNYKPLSLPDDDFSSFYKKHYNIPYYIDSTRFLTYYQYKKYVLTEIYLW